MATTTVRVSDVTHRKLKSLAELTGQPMAQVIDRALDAERSRLLFDNLDEAYARLKSDPQAWAEELAERRLWDNTLLDGLHDDPYPVDENGEPA